MRKSKTLARIRNKETVRMCALGHFIPAYVRHAAHFGFDCIWLDLEHRLISEREVQSLLAFAHLSDIDIMVRSPTLEKTGLYRYLEDGAAGLMIPHVSTPEKAAMLVDAVKFPPIGNRGIDGAGLDSDFLLGDYETFPERANRETFLVVQIETPEDAMFVGPGDLGLRLKHETSGMTLESAFEKVAAAAARHGIAWGCPVGTKEDLQHRRSQGGQLLNHGGEFRALMSMLEECAANFE
jgi:4-hydroxy-2-oxoheptanedioate aldolase